MYYGWWLLAASVVAMALGSGVSFWSFGLYVEPLEDEFGWSRAEVSLGFSAALLVSGLAGPAVGWWIDSRGPRSAIVIGAALTALSFALLATTSSLWEWYLFQSLNAVSRQLMFFMPFQALISRWFNRRRGVALSILATGFSLGGFVVVPLVGLAIDRLGWDGALLLSGIATAAVFLPIGILIVRNSPADIGAEVDGAATPSAGTLPAAAAAALTAREAMRTPLFWVIAVALTLFFFGMFGWMVHQVPFYESVGISRPTAALLISVTAGAGAFSRLGFGLIADRVRRFEYVAVGLAASLATGMLVLLVDSGPVGISLFMLLWVIGTGGGPMMEALLLTRAFGVTYFATILGAVVVVETAGQVVSPTLAGAIFDSKGSYDLVQVLYATTFVASLFCFLLASRLRSPLDAAARRD